MGKKNKRRKKKNKVVNKSKEFYKQIKDASEEYDSLVKEDVDKDTTKDNLKDLKQENGEEEKVEIATVEKEQEDVQQETIKKEKGSGILYFSVCLMLILIVYVGSLLVDGLSKDYSLRNCKVTCNVDKVYQYSGVNIDDFSVKFGKGLGKKLSKLPESYQCKLLNTSYSSDEVGISIYGKIFKVEVTLVEAKDIEWKLKGKDKVTRKDIENAKKEDYECTITYKDKTKKVIKPDKVSVEDIEDGVSVILDCGGSIFSWEPDLSER